MPSVRVRFAPSPTGYLHVGGARTALFNWLYARHSGGTFLLRIEDTDKERSSEEHTKIILDGLSWLGLDWDEDVVFQGAGLKRHQAVADRLLKEGKAHVEEGAIRFRMPQGEIAWDDAVHGRISFRGEDLQDFIILRSDRTPIYNLAVVADDIEMRVTHVLRGDDHISNTPKQIALYRALGVEPPVFGHVPMIHGPDGKKLSKRHGATAVGDYKHFGILASALRNFLALLGWSPGGDRELFFDLQEMIDAFSLEGIQKKSAIFDMVKLQWVNAEHMRHLARAAPEPLIDEVISLAPQLQPFRERVKHTIQFVVPRSSTTTDLAAQLQTRLQPGVRIEPDQKAVQFVKEEWNEFLSTLTLLPQHLERIPATTWQDAIKLESELKRICQELGKPAGKVFQPIRIAVTGSTVSEPVHELLTSVGREETTRRVRQALLWPNLEVPSTSAHVSEELMRPRLRKPEDGK